MDNNKSRGIFLGVLSVATLIVSIIGATFAYFVASASGNTGNVQAGAANVADTLTLSEAVDYRQNMIPVTEEIMKTSYKRTDEATGTGTGRCEGYSKAGGNTVYNLCSIYQFTVSNTASIAQTIYASLTANTNTFTNLKYCIFEGAAGTSDTTKVACRNMPTAGTTDSNIFSEVIPAKVDTTPGTHTYTLVMYINETTEDQTTADSGKAFAGTISITSADGSNHMTGAVETQVRP